MMEESWSKFRERGKNPREELSRVLADLTNLNSYLQQWSAELNSVCGTALHSCTQNTNTTAPSIDPPRLRDRPRRDAITPFIDPLRRRGRPRKDNPIDPFPRGRRRNPDLT